MRKRQTDRPQTVKREIITERQTDRQPDQKQLNGTYIQKDRETDREAHCQQRLRALGQTQPLHCLALDTETDKKTHQKQIDRHMDTQKRKLSARNKHPNSSALLNLPIGDLGA